MKKILILAPYPPYKSPSQRYRFEHFLPLFHQHGLSYEYHSFIDETTWDIVFKKGHSLQKIGGTMAGFLRRLRLMWRVKQFDWVFIHREASPVGPPIFEWIIGRLLKKKIIYDFDDAIWLQQASENNKIISWIKWSRKAKYICRIAYRVSTGNQFLADFASQFNRRIIINPTVVNTLTSHKGRKSHQGQQARYTIGWTGTFTTLPHLQSIIPVLRNLQKQHDFNIVVICNKNPQLDLQHYEYIEWTEKNEASDILRFDVGIMPLPDTEWARGKCGFKAIQYMSLGIPAVVSDVGVNGVIVDDGQNGFVCRTDEDWIHALKQLLTDPNLRAEMGARASEKIAQQYSVQSQEAFFFTTFDNV